MHLISEPYFAGVVLLNTADIWWPERFLEEIPNTPTVGVFANM